MPYPIRSSRPIDGTSLSLTATSAAAVAIMPNVPDVALGATIQPSAPIRVRCDGSDPTTTTGLLVDSNQVLDLESYQECELFQMIAVDATASVEVAFWR